MGYVIFLLFVILMALIISYLKVKSELLHQIEVNKTLKSSHRASVDRIRKQLNGTASRVQELEKQLSEAKDKAAESDVTLLDFYNQVSQQVAGKDDNDISASDVSTILAEAGKALSGLSHVSRMGLFVAWTTR